MAAPVHGWIGNIGSDPEFREFPNGNQDPRRLCRLNVYFDNPVPDGKGGREDKGGFWMQVEYWHREAEHFSQVLQKGMRVSVTGRQIRDTWPDKQTGEPKEAFKIQATQVAVTLNRIDDIVMTAKQQPQRQAGQQQAPQRPPSQQASTPQQQAQPAPAYDSFDDDFPL
ncbi:single-stranded DNA-binding protein [Pseudomonas lopnurensis]|uniref:single-stranded DNA-binding protein n=1 Tax=Pseudomonas lopnurensis TaxID=1477517 RepID=UPI0028ABB11C|nr:single-stranded DNA-binding protein [Pseudomonas lopnurensis]